MDTTNQSATIQIAKDAKTVWIACGHCDRVTHHEALAEIKWCFDSAEIAIWHNYMIVMCKGCRTLSFCIESTDSEAVEYDENGETSLARSYQLFPSRAAGRPELQSIHDVPFGIYSVYRETRSALCSGQAILTGIGIRAIVEAVCKERSASGRNLEDKIDALAAMKIVTDDGAKILHSLRFMGNNAAHEVKAHSMEELHIAFGVIEYLLQGVYIMPKQATKLPQSPP